MTVTSSLITVAGNWGWCLISNDRFIQLQVDEDGFEDEMTDKATLAKTSKEFFQNSQCSPFLRQKDKKTKRQKDKKTKREFYILYFVILYFIFCPLTIF